MTDTFSRSALRDTPSQALRRPLYDPSVDESVEECVPRAPKTRYAAAAAEPTDPSIFRGCPASVTDEEEADESGIFDEPTLDPDLRSPEPEDPEREARTVARPSAMRGMMLAFGLLGGGAAVAAAFLLALAVIVGAALVASEGGPSITSGGTPLPASSPDLP